MKELLIEKKNAHELCGIYNDDEKPNTFDVGYVVGVSDEFVALANLSPNGDWDGIKIFEIDCIFKIEQKSKYLKSIELLSGNKPNSIGSNNIFTNDHLIDSLFSYAKDHSRIVSVALISSECDDVTGFIMSNRDGIVQMQAVDAYADMDGDVLFYINDVAYVSMDTDEERKIEKLLRIRCLK